MDERWSHAREEWTRAFSPLEASGYSLRRVDEKEYWETHERELRGDFPPEVFFSIEALRTPEVVAKRARLDELRAAQPLADFCLVYDGEQLAATFSGHQHGRRAYRMWHTNVAAVYRRRGIYKQILAGTIAYTRELGFATIVSEHAPCNNPVLIAKLSAGFQITGLDVEPMVGMSVLLTYYHNDDERQIYRHRCGLATLNPRIVATAFGAFDQLAAQLREPQK